MTIRNAQISPITDVNTSRNLDQTKVHSNFKNRTLHCGTLVAQGLLLSAIALSSGLGFALANDFIEGGKLSDQTSQVRRAR